MRTMIAFGRIGPNRRPTPPHQGFCTGCKRTVVVTNPQKWDPPFDLVTGECSNCGSTISCYPALPDGEWFT